MAGGALAVCILWAAWPHHARAPVLPAASPNRLAPAQPSPGASHTSYRARVAHLYHPASLPPLPRRRKVEEVKDALNVTSSGGSGARRIAGEAGREYVLHKEPTVEEAAAALAARHAPQPQPAEGHPTDQQPRVAAQQALSPGNGAGAAAAGAGATGAAAAGAAGVAADAAVDGVPQGVLDICFEVGLGDSEGVQSNSKTSAQFEGVIQWGSDGGHGRCEALLFFTNTPIAAALACPSPQARATWIGRMWTQGRRGPSRRSRRSTGGSVRWRGSATGA